MFERLWNRRIQVYLLLHLRRCDFSSLISSLARLSSLACSQSLACPFPPQFSYLRALSLRRFPLNTTSLDSTLDLRISISPPLLLGCPGVRGSLTDQNRSTYKGKIVRNRERRKHTMRWNENEGETRMRGKHTRSGLDQSRQE